MKRKGEDIINDWLLTKNNCVIAYHNIEQELPIFGRVYGVQHNASYYCRLFRKIKEKGHKMFEFIKQDTSSVADSWLVKKKWEE